MTEALARVPQEWLLAAAVVALVRADERRRCVAELRGHSKERMDTAVSEVSAGRDNGFAGVRFASTLDKAARLLESGELSVPPVELVPQTVVEASDARS